MIKVIPNQVLCKNCMTNLEYESSDVIETTTIINYPKELDNDILLGRKKIVNCFEEVSQNYIECPICKTKVILYDPKKKNILNQ